MFALMTLLGCTGGDGFVGDDIGQPLAAGDNISLDVQESFDDVEPSSPAEGSNGDFAGDCLALDTPVPDPPMVAEGGDNMLFVTHFGILTTANPDWTITGLVEDDSTIVMNYAEGSTGAAECMWELRYTIYNVPAGTWTVEARGDDATATVTDP